MGTEFLQLGIEMIPQVLALILPVVGEHFVCSVSHPHMDHIVWYPLVICPPNLLKELKTPVLHVL